MVNGGGHSINSMATIQWPFEHARRHFLSSSSFLPRISSHRWHPSIHHHLHRHILFFCILFLLSFPLLVHSIAPITSPPFDLDNSLLGQPNISCHPDTIEMRFRTKRPFTGKIYVQGHYNNPDCRVDFSQAGGADHDGRGGIRLHHGSCDMNRQRIVRPAEGMQFSTILVISFHPLFVTKTDRAFHINCMYREIDQDVDAGVTVGDVTPADIQNDMPLPNCHYTIRKDKLDGEILKFARVGDFIVHRWECDSDMYGMLVHSCYVDDGQGDRVEVIDEHGCHKDPNVLGDPTYAEALNLAYRESYVFKFRDRLGVRFACEIKLCVKADDGCADITVPARLPRRRGGGVHFQNSRDDPVSISGSRNNQSVASGGMNKNRIRRHNHPPPRANGGGGNGIGGGRTVVDADLISQYVFVLDEPVEGEEDEEGGGGGGDERRLMMMNKGGGQQGAISHVGTSVCINSPLFFALVIVVLLTFGLAIAVVANAICRQYKNSRPGGGFCSSAGSSNAANNLCCPSSPSIGSARSSCSPSANYFMKR